MRRDFLYPGIIALLCTFHTTAFAKNSEPELLPLLSSPGNWFFSLGSGAQFPNWHNSMKVNNSSTHSEKDLYETKDENGAVIALALGRRWQHDSFWFPSYSFGVLWQYLFRINLGDTFTLNSPPVIGSYKYNWELTSNLLLASAKLNLFQYGKFSPYVNAGIGSSFNRTSNYKETPLQGAVPRTNPAYGKFSTSEFAYNVGVGIDLQLTQQFIMSLGYNYQDLGQISSGPGKSAWSNQSLNPGSFHSNEILFSVSYLFGKQTESKEK